jgi:hypothetical protein
LKRTLGNKYEHLSTCGVFWWQSFAILCEFSSEKKIQCQMCFISENLLLPQRRENTTKHWYEHIKTKKPFLKKNLKNLKKNSQKLKFNSVPHNDKDIEFDDTKKQI